MFKKGTSNAQKFTLSFWVKSNKTGTAQVNLRDMDNTRMIGASYSISVADTWEYKVCNFAADTTGKFDDDNARLIFDPDHSENEDRFILLGLSCSLKVLVVVHCYKDEENIIRLISARKATKPEKINYKELL